MKVAMLLFRRISRIWEGYNMFERAFWTVILTMSSYGLGIFSYYTFQRYISDPVSMTLETEFLNWNFSFPAVSICLTKGKNNQPNDQVLKALNISSKKNKPMLRELNNCMFLNPNDLDSVRLLKCSEFLTSYNVSIGDLIDIVLPKSCHVFMDFFYYDDKEYNCSEVFKFHKQELGHCFIANSIADYDLSLEKLKLKYNRETKNKALSTRLRSNKLWQYMLFIHSPEDMPSYNSFSKDVYTAETKYSVNVDTIITDADSASKSIHERGCRFPHEKLAGSPFHYSFTTCIVYARIKMELEVCNCTHSSSPEVYRSRYCNSTGIRCLLADNLFVKAYNLVTKNNICMPSCTEQIVRYVGQSEMKSETSASYTDITVEVVDIASVRLKRVVTNSKLDLAVSIAGLAGLFFGVSVLNFVELLYYLITGK